MERALDEFIIEGIKTTIPFHLEVMRSAGVPDGHLRHQLRGELLEAGVKAAGLKKVAARRPQPPRRMPGVMRVCRPPTSSHPGR